MITLLLWKKLSRCRATRSRLTSHTTHQAAEFGRAEYGDFRPAASVKPSDLRALSLAGRSGAGYYRHVSKAVLTQVSGWDAGWDAGWDIGGDAGSGWVEIAFRSRQLPVWMKQTLACDLNFG